MYIYIDGNIFESPAKTLVNTVNTAGAMGKGLALSFKRLFPDMFKKYQLLCESGKLIVGRLWLYQTTHKWVLNFPTKKHWRYPSRIEYVEAGLRSFVDNYERARIFSIAFPKLGCGNGELNWSDVKPLMERYLKKLPIDVYVYEGNSQVMPEHKDVKRMRQWLMSEPHIYPFIEVKNDLIELLRISNRFYDMGGTNFTANFSEDGLIFTQNADTTIVPWVGDQSGLGLLEIWQSIREKGLCTASELIRMGVKMPKQFLALLLELPYIKILYVKGVEDSNAIQLVPYSAELPLFKKIKNTVESYKL